VSCTHTSTHRAERERQRYLAAAVWFFSLCFNELDPVHTPIPPDRRGRSPSESLALPRYIPGFRVSYQGFRGYGLKTPIISMVGGYQGNVDFAWVFPGGTRSGEWDPDMAFLVLGPAIGGGI
jgi:hypothetical protein